MTKRKKLRKAKARRPSKPKRLAHEILTKTLDANLTLDETVEALIMVLKGVVVSSTEDDDPDDRSGMIEWITDHIVGSLMEIDPNIGRPHVWFVPPQGTITEPVGILWSGFHDDEDNVQVVLGKELETFRAEVSTMDAHVTEGVEGIAIVDPDWDGKSTAKCGDCGENHDVHLMIAEALFAEVQEQRRQQGAAN